ncbi:unnamed protein product, partial [Rotaria sp. Silwood1]
MVGNNFDTNKIKSIVNNLKKIQRAKQFVLSHINKPDELEKCINDIKSKIEKQLQRFLKEVEAFVNIDNFYEAEQKVELIISVRNLLGNYCSQQISDQIDRVNANQAQVLLDGVVNKYSDMDFDKYVSNPPSDFFNRFNTARRTILIQDSSDVGHSIITEHQAFKGYALSLFNEKILKHASESLLDNGRPSLDPLISETKMLAGNIKQTSDNIQWDAPVRNKIPTLLAHIFALWTLQSAHHYFEVGNVGNNNSYLLQPHIAQVISIFCMLGLDDIDEKLRNNLVQIRTGEGKSVILAVTAAILALLGFEVRCACYSQYLSERDCIAFLPLFDALNITEYIQYGTFNKLCEDMINRNGEIRKIVEHFISTDSNNSPVCKRPTERAKILLIDEVDVFFSQNFYGNVYTPSASLRDPTITSLINFIWKERKSKLSLRKVTYTDEYKACCNRFPLWESLILEAVKDLIHDVNSFDSHDYVVKEDKIGYKEQDKIVYNIVYGYKTLFVYYCEHEKGKITKSSLEERISINIKCGNFSYAEIPLQFKFIMGVSGTLKTLSNIEKETMKTVYKIEKLTFIPSMFGKNNLKFTEKDDIMIENIDDYFNVIRKEIDDRLVGKSGEKRAVLVFFESVKRLNEFYESKALEEIKYSVHILTEEATSDEKEKAIRCATTSDQITLFTRTFGRGTDFICHDKIVEHNGGTHVIQTFLSEEYSEEVQIKGRTARQGDHGSYSLVLLDQDLEKFLIQKEDIENIKKGKGVIDRLQPKLSFTKTYCTLYELLDNRRKDLFEKKYMNNTQYVEQAKKEHEATEEFLKHFQSADIDYVRKFLVEKNKGANIVCNQSRTICLMDATGSMTHLLNNCKNTVGAMFERTIEILRDDNIIEDSFQIQFVVYRNYNSTEDKILQYSPWETRADNLRTFMNTINVEGGDGNEAIEIGLWHANNENTREKITQVILIGDAPPNTKDE